MDANAHLMRVHLSRGQSMIRSTALWIVVCLAAMCVTSPGQSGGPTLIAQCIKASGMHIAQQNQALFAHSLVLIAQCAKASHLHTFFALNAQCIKASGMQIAQRNHELFAHFYCTDCTTRQGLRDAQCALLIASQTNGPFAHFFH